jgi:hypothetical protein
LALGASFARFYPLSDDPLCLGLAPRFLFDPSRLETNPRARQRKDTWRVALGSGVACLTQDLGLKPRGLGVFLEHRNPRRSGTQGQARADVIRLRGRGQRRRYV